MTARISRDYLSDETIARARKAMLAQLSMIGAMTHRFRDDYEIVDELKRDDEALCSVLGILIGEEHARSIEDRENAL